jgi:FKBP-type peptidyl-prolyl cis-trans isomerase
MRLCVLICIGFVLGGCGQQQNLGRELTKTQDELSSRVHKIDTSMAPPALPLPKNPPKQIDIQKVRDVTARITELKIEDVVIGAGKEVAPGKFVTVHYVGTLPDGYLFDTSYKGDSRPFTFKYDVDHPKVIEGWMRGLKGMKVGGHRRLTIPASLAYGANPPAGSPIPPNAALMFEIQLMFVSDTE